MPVIRFVILIGILGWQELSANPIDIYTPDWVIKGSGTAFYTSGNVERVLARGELQAAHHEQSWAFATTTAYTWGTFGQQRTENDWSGRNFLYAMPHSVVYPFAMHWLETGLRRKIQMRNQAGAGLTLAMLSSKQAVLKLSGMVSGEATEYDQQPYLPDGTEQPQQRPLPRFTPRLYYRHNFTDALNLTTEIWYQQSLHLRNDFRWHLESALEFRLGPALSLKALVLWHYESAVPVVVKRYDLNWTAGVTAAWNSEKEEK